MKKYEKYEDSGVEWIGEVPEEWDVCSFKWLNNGTNTGEAIDKSFWTNTQEDAVFYTAGLNPITTSYKDFPEEKYTNENDLLFARNGTPYVYYPPVHAIYTDHIIRASIYPSNCKRYVYYALSFAISHEVVDSVSIPTWSASLWNEQKIVLPSLSEQFAIAAYLDRKVGQIDASVAAVDAQIDDLKKYRQSIISEAVTKGLNQNVKMKDSGVEWIGEVPEEWEILPMKRGLTINNGRDYKEIQTEDGYPVIGSGGQFACASDYLYDGEALLLGRKGTIDKPMYINGKFWTVDTMFYAVPNDNVCCKYMYYQSQTIPFGLYSTNTALPSMTQTDLANNPMCFPPLSEQQAIAAYLDAKTLKIDEAIKSLEAQRNDLGRLKQSVISEAVTGKIDVRN